VARLAPGVGEGAYLLAHWLEHYLDDCPGGVFPEDLVLRSGAFVQAHFPEYTAALRTQRTDTQQLLRAVGAVWADTGETV